MGWLIFIFIAGVGTGFIGYGLLEAWQHHRVAKRQRALGLTFGSVGGEPRTPAELDAQMLRHRGIGRGC